MHHISCLKLILLKSAFATAIMTVAFCALTVRSSDALAERSCKYVQRLNEELNCGLVSRDDDDDDARSSTSSRDSSRDKDHGKDYVISRSFGPTECKMAGKAKEAVGEFKNECQNWLKERKSELKGKYQTGACADQCEDCSLSGVTGKTCSVQGSVHYTNGK